jgi:hypothetical protein
MGGGNNSYENYKIPTRLTSNSNAIYSAIGAADGCSITGTSTSVENCKVEGAVDKKGALVLSFSGADFLQ